MIQTVFFFNVSDSFIIMFIVSAGKSANVSHHKLSVKNLYDHVVFEMHYNICAYIR